MPVKLNAPQATSLLPVRGIQLGYAMAHVRKPNRKDVLVMTLAEGSRAAGVFTKNRFCAAPVILCQTHLANTSGIRALLSTQAAPMQARVKMAWRAPSKAAKLWVSY